MSIVDLWDAEANLVMATPVALKQAIETTIPRDISRSYQLFINAFQASVESSITPLGGFVAKLLWQI